MKKNFLEMEVINHYAAGIDVGSKSHFVSVGQNLTADIREFGVYSGDHDKMIKWLKERNITSIAMESTGSYWQTLFAALQCAGFEVILVNGNQTKTILGKTDVKDSRWIQKLHCLGLLHGSFLPSEHVAKLRILNRHRAWLTQETSKLNNKMQKALRLMNLRLDIVLCDIMGQSGKAIVEAIIQGERDGTALANLVNYRVKKSKQEIAASLQGQWSEELLYELTDCYNLHKEFEARILSCDQQIEKILNLLTSNKANYGQKLTKKKRSKNQISFDLINLSYLYFGVDLFAIEGVSYNTVMTLISEVGTDLKKFKTDKQFVKWLRLAPDNRISGGKIISSRTPKGKNILAIALRNAANTIDNKKEGHLYSFFKRIAYKKGRGAAITATARKLAIIIWNMYHKQEEYKPMDETQYLNKIRQKTIKNIQAKIKRLNLSMSELEPNLEFS